MKIGLTISVGIDTMLERLRQGAQISEKKHEKFCQEMKKVLDNARWLC